MNSSSRWARNSSTAQCRRSLTSWTTVSSSFAHAVDEGLEAVDVDQHDELLGARLEAEEGETTGDLLFVEIAGDELVEEVAGEALLGLGDGLLLDQLERRDGDHVVQDDAVVVGELAAVLDDGEEGADAVRGHDRVDLHAAARAVRQLDREVLPRGALVGDLLPEVGDQLGWDCAGGGRPRRARARGSRRARPSSRPGPRASR